MLHFECDYNNGCHPEILKALTESNSEYESGYGFDSYTELAKKRIREACNCPDADVFLLVGGTQTNSVVIFSLLQPWQGVVAAATGHIEGHEAGAIENTGHKVLTIGQKDGKINAAELKSYLANFYNDENHMHMAYPGMVYISFPTEFGTIYSRSELEDIHTVCRDYGIPLFIDGARLGYGLCSHGCDMNLAEFASLCDVFYIGGTKVGALCGEAVVFPNGNVPEHFFTMVKQRGALLAKGRLLGVQFATLFNNNLYFEISRHAIELAETLKAILHRAGFEFFLETDTNQQFVIIENSRLEKLNSKVISSFWEKYDENHTVIRFCTSWSTTEEDLKALEQALS